MVKKKKEVKRIGDKKDKFGLWCSIVGGIIGLLSGVSALGIFWSPLTFLYSFFLANQIQWILFSLYFDEGIVWILLPFLMGVVGMLYGLLFAWIIKKIRGNK